MAKFPTNACDAIWWPNFVLMQEFPTNSCGATCWLNLLATRYLQLWSQPMGPLCLWQCLYVYLYLCIFICLFVFVYVYLRICICVFVFLALLYILVLTEFGGDVFIRCKYQKRGCVGRWWLFGTKLAFQFWLQSTKPNNASNSIKLSS